MKRMLLAVLALMVILCGCMSAAPQETTAAPETTQPTTVPEPTSLYAADDPAEKETGGAVKTYLLDRSGGQGMEVLGNKLVVFLEAGGTELILIDPADGTIVRTQQLSCSVDPKTQSVQIGAQGMGYYDQSNHVVVFLDAMLREVSRVQLPETIVGEPVIAPTLDKVYYCTTNEIRVIDAKTGISRLLRQEENAWTTLSWLYFDGQILSYPAVDESGKITYLDTATGALLGVSKNVGWMETCQQQYALMYTDAGSGMEELLVASKGETLQKLTIRKGRPLPLLNVGAVVTCDEQEGLMLDYYTLASGSRTAELKISGEKQLISACALQENVIWLMVYDAQKQYNVLYCWDALKSAVADDTRYLGPWYTAENPDLTALAACQSEADAIAEKYGVDIRIGNYAVEVACDYAMMAEFQPEIIREKLQIVDAALAKFPEDFLKTIGKVSKSGKFHICLVRSVAENVTGVQFWDNGDAYAAVQLYGDLEYNLYLELYPIIDTYVFNNTSTLDTWDWLNPKSFTYFETYQFTEDQVDQKLLEGEDRAFITQQGMTYPREDRAEFFAAAVTDGHKELFASKTMQEKLTSLGKGIRNAFGWKKDERSFPWEQYLDKALAYTKKK